MVSKGGLRLSAATMARVALARKSKKRAPGVAIPSRGLEASTAAAAYETRGRHAPNRRGQQRAARAADDARGGAVDGRGAVADRAEGVGVARIVLGGHACVLGGFHPRFRRFADH